ncbi:gliding motility lipoprotein GldH [Olivibacter sitiensis]|uniref:gliding motility lipoprotein GldH n=1 Tax=Olivibacter sitiensis TaxID=376470 RepID=UPI00146FBF79|nr:gliding motility lipoprotein GldH [Olivibacter sitiensis]
MGRTINQRTAGSRARWCPMLVIAACCFVLFVCSCEQGAVIDEFRAIPERDWAYSFHPSFDVPIKDTTQAYDLKLNLRVTGEYKYSNIYVLVRQRNPNGKTNTDRVQLKLADADGRWLGQGGGGLYTYQAAFKRRYYFPDTGTYKIEIEQNMRDNPLKQVSDIGVCVVPSRQ